MDSTKELRQRLKELNRIDTSTYSIGGIMQWMMEKASVVRAINQKSKCK